LQYIDSLPTKIKHLNLSDNKLPFLPTLPTELITLKLGINYMKYLPSLPEKLKLLHMMSMYLDSLPELPESLEEISCVWGFINKIPKLPSKLKLLDVSLNNIESIPKLPTTLEYLICSGNKINSIPNLPPLLKILYFDDNKLESIPDLPSGLKILNLSNNNILCMPPIPIHLRDTTDVYLGNSLWYKMKGIDIKGNPLTCLPNYVQAMDTNTLKLPICNLNDTIQNPYGCYTPEGIKGVLFQDNNNNCVFDFGEKSLKNIPVNLRDANRKILAKQFTFNNGSYFFLCPKGTYYIEVDTLNLPVEFKCFGGIIEKKIVKDDFIPNVKDIDFGLSCKKINVLDVHSILTEGIVFPGRKHTLRISVGEKSQWIGMNCSQGLSGGVRVTVRGKMKYLNPAIGARIPEIIDDSTFLYYVSNFGDLNMKNDFGLVFKVDTLAGISDSIKVDVDIFSDTINPNLSIVNKKHTYQILNSYDPNFKEVYPINLVEKYNGWLTYTIHFQNTGTAPAFDIKLIDTLDTKLNLETFQVLNYSHPMRTELYGNIARFIFNDIMLVDSHTNYDSSCGYVQYRIKPLSKYLNGTKLYNTAYIYFDYNPPIVTNTTINEYVKPLYSSINYIADKNKIIVFPNPNNGLISINSKLPFVLSVKDIQGREIINSIDSKSLILPKGIYFFEFIIDDIKTVEKVIVY
jgi:uncharacterized repeat protein (TIGR01451 family)